MKITSTYISEREGEGKRRHLFMLCFDTSVAIQ